MITTFQRILNEYPDKELLKEELTVAPYSILLKKWKCGSAIIKKLKEHFNIQQDYATIRLKADQARVQNGSARRLHKKYRHIESLDVQELIGKVKNSNMTDVALELGIPRHILSGHLKRNGFEQEKTFKRSNPSWIKGLTKETDPRVNAGAEKVSETRKQLFAEGKLQQPDAFMTPEQIKERQEKGEQTRLERYGNTFGNIGWNEGLTKETSPIMAKAAKKQSKTRKRLIASGVIDKWTWIGASKFEHTSIELAIEAELTNRGILFETQKVLYNKFLVDEVIEEYKIVIFADGCYWHGCPEHKKGFKKLAKRQAIDKSQNAYLTKCGYKVFRFWEHEIKKDVKACVDQIEAHINEQKA
jgi:DNA mismatch endonuclease (patch repair protein)